MSKTRLEDRGKRHGKNNDRKKVYLIKNASGKSVEHVYAEKYRQIFDNSVAAITAFPSGLLPKLIDHQDLKLTFEFAGMPIAPSQQAFSVAKTISRLAGSTKIAKLGRHRYLRELEEFYPRFASYKWDFTYGLDVITGTGIDDPVLSNYVQDDDGDIKLVDLDNFQPSISVGFQIGFLITDILVLTKSDLSQGSFLEIANRYWKIEGNERSALLQGYCARLFIAALDSGRLELQPKEHYLELIDSITLD